MAVLKLKPSCKDYLWGGHKLVEEYNKSYTGERLAETWEVSCHPDGESMIVSGENEGMTLQAYIDKHGIEVLGKNCRRFQEFPILIKFIDAKDNLSIQVHPDNGYALKNEGQYGKTEMWYVAECKEGSFLYYGFSVEITKEEFERRIKNDTLLEVLNKVPVQKGDVLFIEAGTIHAIGKDIVIAEIQQNSNITYRVYDYGRVGQDGKQRDLHIEKALEVTNRIPIIRNKSAIPHLAKCDYFTVDKLNLDGSMMKKIEGTIGWDSFVSILVLEGEGKITSEGQTSFKKGDSLFLPSGSGKFEIEGECEALITTIGEKASPIRIAFDMTSKDVTIALMDMQYECIAKEKYSIEKNENYLKSIKTIGEMVLKLLQEQDIQIDNCVGIGAGIPGIIDSKEGHVLYSNNLKWENVPFKEEIKKYIPLPIYMNNNANCVALGEKIKGAAQKYKNMVMITIGNGVGCSIIVDGKIFDIGSSEIGHMVVQIDGEKCSCGRRGCLEAYISKIALIRQTKEAMLANKDSILWEICKNDVQQVTETTPFIAAEQGDETGKKIVDRYLKYLTSGIANVINMFRPEIVVISGTMFEDREYLLENMESRIKHKCFGGTSIALPKLKLAKIGDKAGLIGAASLI